MDEGARMGYRDGLYLLDGLEEETLGDDALTLDTDEEYLIGIDEWWDDFVSDSFL
jgi:hypothetical protein